MSKGEKGKARASCSKWPWGKYTTTFPFLGSDVRGPAQACQSSKSMEDEQVGESEFEQHEEEEDDDDDDKQ